jgi:hypothetical protein
MVSNRPVIVAWWIAVALIPAAARAQTRSFAELLQQRAVNPGDRVTVRDAQGSEQQGRVVSLTDSALVISRDGRRTVTFAERDVSRIDRRGGHAKAWGALIGAGGAFALTALAANSYGNNEGGRFCDACLVAWSVLTVPAGAGLGAVVGWAIDLGRHKTLFVAPSRSPVAVVPVIGPRKGVMVSVRF